MIIKEEKNENRRPPDKAIDIDFCELEIPGTIKKGISDNKDVAVVRKIGFNFVEIRNVSSLKLDGFELL